MNEYYTKHKHFILLWLILLTIVGVSGYLTYFRKTEIQTNQTIQNNIKQEPEIEKEKIIANTKKVISIQEKKSAVNKVDDIPARGYDTITEPTTTTPKIAETEYDPPPITTATNTTPFKLAINDQTIEAQTEQGATVFKAMQNLMAENKISFHATNYSGIGYFVDEIGGIKNDQQNGLYWIYYINGQSASVGISLYSLKPNDIITWKYEKSKF